MFDTMMIAKRIKDARIAKNMTQMNLADELGVSYQAVSNWERGNSMPDISKLGDLCTALDLTVDELLGVENKSTAAVNKIMQNEEVTPEELAEVAPILPPDAIKIRIDANKYRLNFETIADMAPFLDAQYVSQLVLEANLNEQEKIEALEWLGPYLNKEALEKIAPFLSKSTVNQLMAHGEKTRKLMAERTGGTK